MELKLKDLRSSKNPKARIKILQGHFATGNSHINTYIDMSTVKTRHNNAREAAKELAKEYLTTTMVDTIVCLDETEVIGTFLAEILYHDVHEQQKQYFCNHAGISSGRTDRVPG